MATRLTALLCLLAAVSVSAKVDGRLASLRKAYVGPWMTWATINPSPPAWRIICRSRRR